MEDTKPFYLSKTLWVNFLALLAAVSAAFGFDLGLDDQTKSEIAIGGIAVVNLILRLVTTKAVTT